MFRRAIERSSGHPSPWMILLLTGIGAVSLTQVTRGLGRLKTIVCLRGLRCPKAVLLIMEDGSHL